MNANLVLSQVNNSIERVNNLLDANEILFEDRKISAKLINHQNNRLALILRKLERLTLIAFVPQMIERGCFN